MAAYTTAAQIRSVENAFSDSSDFPDATLTGWADDSTDSIIDARLASAGYTTPLTTVHELIKLISARLAAAHGLRSFVGTHTFRSVESAEAHEKWAEQKLDEIAEGKFDIGVTRGSSGEPVAYDADLDDFDEDTEIVGQEENWIRQPEARE